MSGGEADLEVFELSVDADDNKGEVHRKVVEMLEGSPVRGAPPMPLREILADMRAMVERRLPQLDPDDDVMAMTHVEGETRSMIFLHPFHSDEEKDAVYGKLVPGLIEGSRARAYGTVQPMWNVTREAGDPEPTVPPSLQPERAEGIVVMGSDGTVIVQWFADVTRHDDAPPTIGEWVMGDVIRVGEGGRPGWIITNQVSALLTARLARASRLWLMQRPAEWWTAEKLAAFEVFGEGIDESVKTGVVRTDGAIAEAWKTLYEVGEDGLPEGLLALTRSEDFWELPEPDCDTPAAVLAIKG